ncbi:MAG: hypothetical protein ACFFCS_18435 [Candidatus Hodarchaeota archaeon]
MGEAEVFDEKFWNQKIEKILKFLRYRSIFGTIGFFIDNFFTGWFSFLSIGLNIIIFFLGAINFSYLIYVGEKNNRKPLKRAFQFFIMLEIMIFATGIIRMEDYFMLPDMNVVGGLSLKVLYLLIQNGWMFALGSDGCRYLFRDVKKENLEVTTTYIKIILLVLALLFFLPLIVLFYLDFTHLYVISGFSLVKHLERALGKEIHQANERKGKEYEQEIVDEENEDLDGIFEKIGANFKEQASSSMIPFLGPIRGARLTRDLVALVSEANEQLRVLELEYFCKKARFSSKARYLLLLWVPVWIAQKSAWDDIKWFFSNNFPEGGLRRIGMRGCVDIETACVFFISGFGSTTLGFLMTALFLSYQVSPPELFLLNFFPLIFMVPLNILFSTWGLVIRMKGYKRLGEAFSRLKRSMIQLEVDLDPEL